MVSALFKKFLKRRSLRGRRSSTAGVALLELLTATVITTIVILVVGNGLLSALNMTKAAEAKSARRTELNRGFTVSVDRKGGELELWKG